MISGIRCKEQRLGVILLLRYLLILIIFLCVTPFSSLTAGELKVPVVVSPQNNAVIPFLNRSITFAWRKVENATYYGFSIYDGDKKEVIYRNTRVIPDCNTKDICVFRAPKDIVIPIGVRHEWKVRALNDAHEASEWSGALFSINKNNSNNNLQSYLTSPLWGKIDAYDAGHFGMVPLHASFELEEYKGLKEAFLSQFTSFLDNGGAEELDKLGVLTSLQYYYLMSQYLVLSEKSQLNDDKSKNNAFKGVLCSKLTNLWLHQDAWRYGSSPFKGMSNRIHWKLTTNAATLAYPYYRGIFDEELFLFAIAHDVSQVQRYDECSVIDEILESTHLVINQRSEFTSSGGWLFDSVWDMHPDNKYAGYAQKELVIKDQPIIVPSLPWDSSHFHRFPLWLKSFRDAYPIDDERYLFYQALLDKLAIQFKKNVLVNSGSYWLFNNYMDGWNGVYRYGYPTQGEGNGYGPYELSATPLIGWWYFLGDDEVNSVYCSISNNFPIDSKTIKTYVGPNTSRKTNPMVTLPDSLEQGAIMQTIPQMACHMGNERIYPGGCKSTVVLENDRWNQISLPCSPGNNSTLAAVFGDDGLGRYGEEWAVFSYDISGYHKLSLESELSLGIGYWIIQLSGSDKILDMPDDSIPTLVKGFDIGLSTEASAVRWNMIGAPFYKDGALSLARVVTSSGSCKSGCDLDAAGVAGIVHSKLWTYNGKDYAELGTGDRFDPWKGYWLATLKNAQGKNPQLHLPLP